MVSPDSGAAHISVLRQSRTNPWVRSRHRATSGVRLVGDLNVGPPVPGLDGPDADDLRVVDHGGTECTHQAQAETLGHGQPVFAQEGQVCRRLPRNNLDDLVVVDGRTRRCGDKLFGRRREGRGHDHSVVPAPAKCHRLAPPALERRVLQLGIGELTLEVGGQPVPAVELPHQHHLGPGAGAPHGAPDPEGHHVAFDPPHRTPVDGHMLHISLSVLVPDGHQLMDVHLAIGCVVRHLNPPVDEDEKLPTTAIYDRLYIAWCRATPFGHLVPFSHSPVIKEQR